MSALSPRFDRFAVQTADASDGRETIVYFDGADSEEFSMSVSSSKNPRSFDRRSQDHTTKEPQTFSARLRVNETPLEAASTSNIGQAVGEDFAAIYPQSGGGAARLSEVFQVMQDFRGRRLNVHTTKHGTLEGWEIKSITHRRGIKGHAEYSVQFEEILDAFVDFVSTPTVPNAKKQKKPSAYEQGFNAALARQDGKTILQTLNEQANELNPDAPTSVNF